MKTINVIKHQCEICGGLHDTEDAARMCEATPITQDLGVRVGDKVMVTVGPLRHHKATVDGIMICSDHDPIYRHTVCLLVSVPPATTIVRFDQYFELQEN